MLNITELGIFESTEKFKNMSVTPKRCVNDIEIEFFLSENGSAIINGTEYSHTNGMIICALPNATRYSKGMFSCFYIHIESDKGLCALLCDVPPCFVPADGETIRKAFERMLELYQMTDSASRLLLESEVFSLLHLICLHRASHSEGYFSVRTAMDYMRNNFMQSITLADIAASVNLSEAYFHRKYHALIGETPHQTLMNIRISVAKRMLLCSDASIYEIAEKCGFSSQSYFHYCFKKSTGTTPDSFRKQRFIMPN